MCATHTPKRLVGSLVVAAGLGAWACGGAGPSSYTIGGTLSGLASGQQVTLVDNSSDTLTLAANGSFTFATLVTADGAYSVMIGAQPTGQTCTVTSGSGSGVMANVTTVGVTCVDNPILALLAGSLGGGSGSADGTGAAARFASPSGVAVDSAGTVYVADGGNSTIRKITAGGVVTTLAGTAGALGSIDGTGAAARFSSPTGIAVDSAGTVYVADTGNSRIRKITAAGVVTTLAGSPGGSGSTDGTGAAARFYFPMGIAVDSAGTVYVADTGNSTIREITPAGVVTTLAGTAGATGSADGTGAAASFSSPSGVAVDSAGNLYVADRANSTIREIAPAGVVTTLAGRRAQPAAPTGWARRRGSSLRVASPSTAPAICMWRIPGTPRSARSPRRGW